MTIALSKRSTWIKPSQTLAITAKAAELKRQGKPVISLGAGEPDFDTPQHIKDAAIAAINAGFTKYTAVDGIPELKTAIINKLKQDNKLDYSPEQILVSCGGKQTFFNMALALLNDGDEAIIPAPYWVSYPDMVAITGAKPVIIPTDIKQKFKMQPEQLEQAITDKTKLLVLNSPSNPTGVAYSEAEFAAIGEILAKHPNIIIASDDMYEHILWADEPFISFATANPHLYDQTVTLNGVSKAYSMTGWRIGYAAGHPDLIKAMKKVQSQSTSNPCSISQKAAVAAISGPQECVQEMLTAFKERHDYVIKTLNGIDGIECLPSDGAFYAFAKVTDLMQAKGLSDDIALAEYWLTQANVAVVPGSAFGCNGYVRLSFATSMENLVEALKRIKQLVDSEK